MVKDEIALIISTFPFSEKGPHRWIDLGDNIFNLSTLINRKWLSDSAIDGVLSQLAMLLLGVQLMLFTKAFLHLYRLNIGKPIKNVINLRFSTHIIVFPFNLSRTH